MIDATLSSLPAGEGWANTPTAVVNWWLRREQGLSEAARAAAREGVDALREFTDSLVLGDMPPPGPTTDLLTWALEQIDFDRLADSLGKT